MKRNIFTIKSQINLKMSVLTLILLSFFASFSVSAQPVLLASIKPIAFITDAIGSGVVKTEVLLPDGASPHSYTLKPTDIQKIKRADLIVWIGKDMEIFLSSVLKSTPVDKRLALIDVLAIKPLLHHSSQDGHEAVKGHHHHDVDSHIWLSPEIAGQIAIATHDKLVALYPDQKKQLDKNLADFTKQLKETEQIIAKELINIQNRGYFVFHDAYGYFERHFDLDDLGYFTLNPEIQPGAKKIYSIRRQLIEGKAVCVFKEPQFNPMIIDKVVQNTMVRVGTLDPLGTNIPVSKNAYFNFLTQLASQFEGCLRHDQK